MNSTFASVIEEVQKFSLEEKEELLILLEKYLVEARRDEIHSNYLLSRKEEEQGRLRTPKDENEFRRMLEQ